MSFLAMNSENRSFSSTDTAKSGPLVLWENHLLSLVIECRFSAIIIPVHPREADMLNNKVFGN